MSDLDRPQTPTRRRPIVLGAVLAGAMVVGATACDDYAATSAKTRTPATTAPAAASGAAASTAGPGATKEQVDAAVGQLDGIVNDALKKSGVPGASVAVVYDGQVVAAKGYGVRDTTKPGAVDADTVFQLASVSKPVASSVVAGLVGEGKLKWDDPIVKYDPSFKLSDQWVTDHVTVADMFAHRSGLPDHAGDLLEDLGYDRAEIIRRLQYEPLSPFRNSYAYTNFGLTEGGVAAANAAGMSWEDASKQVLYGPLGMTSTSSRFADFEASPNHAATHVTVDGKSVPKYVRQPDAQTPAGGVSSSANDMAKWLQLQLANGSFNGKQVVAADALLQTKIPQSVSHTPTSISDRPGFYGLGFNVGNDATGSRASHSGAFALGAGTSVSLAPGQKLGLVVLTNGYPTGVAEAINSSFFDVVNTGSVSQDWVTVWADRFKSIIEVPPGDEVLEQPAPTVTFPPSPSTAYVGSYANPFFGTIQVSQDGGTYTMTMGPQQQVKVPLTHLNGSAFTFETQGENATGKTIVTFDVPADGRASSVTINAFNKNGLGTFTRQ